MCRGCICFFFLFRVNGKSRDLSHCRTVSFASLGEWRKVWGTRGTSAFWGKPTGESRLEKTSDGYISRRPGHLFQQESFIAFVG